MAKRKTYSSVLNAPVPQTVRTSPDQVKNSAGGFVWAVDKWDQLRRFLLIGTMGGTYYINESKLTRDNVAALEACLAEDATRFVSEVTDARKGNRALKTDSILFALAMAVKEPASRDMALASVPEVCKTGTQLFQLVGELDGLGAGWGRKVRRGIASWYNRMPLDKLSYQLAKYQQREGWSHRDVLRLCHPDPKTGAGWEAEKAEGPAAKSYRDALYRWAVGKPLGETLALSGTAAAFEHAKATDKAGVVDLIREHNLPRECVPTQFLNDKDVWLALLEKMPATAMVRNLGKMGSLGLFDGIAKMTVCERLTDPKWVADSRIHPLSFYLALKVYSRGQGVKGSLTWRVEGDVLDALSKAVELSFGSLPKTDKRIRVAVDYSGSMQSPTTNPLIQNHEAAAVMAKAFLHQGDCDVLGFGTGRKWIGVSKGQRVDDMAKSFYVAPEGTDMGQAFCDPDRKADVVVVFTDNETWAGRSHANDEWRKFAALNPGAKVVVCAMAANSYSGIDPGRADVLQVVGFDTAIPQIVATFAGLDSPSSEEE